MSYVPANESRDLSLIVGLVVTTIGASTLWLRLERSGTGKIIGHCADGTVIGLWRDGMRRRPGRRPEERARARAAHPEAPSSWRDGIEDDLEPGDLSFVRLREGRSEDAPWMIEGLDRGCEFVAIAWGFADRAEAELVLRRLGERIVRPARDERGVPIPMNEADLEAVQSREIADAQPPTLEA